MAGIYIHIPFCKTRCIYCDFYSTTRSDLKERYIRALCRELRIRKDYLEGATIETIYFGGGTPSQLDEEDFRQVFATIEEVYGMEHCKEITLEANPDDLTEEYVTRLHRLPFNRISMGIQTFDDVTLKLLNRRHNAMQAVSLNVEHISAYHLTYEEGTRIYELLQAHRIRKVDEESSVRFFSVLIDTLDAAGYEHYEISNFCRPGKYSRHNTSYWKGIPYLGCGPAAHSFNTHTREWNVASLEEYMQGIETDRRKFETEYRDKTTCYNECIMTCIRTLWGISLKYIEMEFGTEMWKYCMDMATPYLESGKLKIQDNHLCLTREGIFISDGIISDLMFIEE